jgi:hypothetical protein
LKTVAVVLAAGLLAAIAAAWMLRPAGAPPAPEHKTVGSYFDAPPPWPGPAWQVGGNRTAGWPEIDASAGPAHCGWDAYTFLTMGWPPGNSSPTAPSHQYVRDTSGRMVGAHLLGVWAHNTHLPRDAAPLYRYGTLTLYIASDSDRYVYVVAPGDSERWPRSDPPTMCL